MIERFSKKLANRIPLSFVSDKFIRYLAVGFTTVGLDYLLFTILFSLAGLPYLRAQLIDGAFIFIFNFTSHRRVTFQKRGGTRAEKRGELFRYTLLTAWNYFASAGLLYFWVEFLGLHPLLAKVFTIGTIISWNFPILKYFVYRTP